MKLRLILLLFSVTACTLRPSFASEYKFRTLSPSGGFYYDGIKAIEQDRDGFVWIMMDYELYRFDGLQYKKYHSYFTVIDHTKKWIFNNMASDSAGYLYVNTDYGLYRYDRISDTFERIYEGVGIVKVDSMDNLWIWDNRVWSILDVATKSIYTPQYDGKQAPNTLSVFCTHKNDLYTFAGQKIYRFNYAKKEFVICSALPGTGGNIRFAQAYQGKLWVVLAMQGLYKIDLSTFKPEDHYDTPEPAGNPSRAFYIDKKGRIWFGTIDGLHILDPVTRIYSHYAHSENDPFSLPNNSIWIINGDRQNNVWLGTYSGTLCYANIDEDDAFETFLPQNSGLNYVPVSSFAETRRYLWVATEGGGINRMDKETHQFTYIDTQKGLSSNNVKSLVADESENLWISMYMGGLDYYDTKKNRVTNRKHRQGDPNSLLVNSIRKTILEGDSGVWVIYQHAKPEISYLSLRDDKCTHFRLDSIGRNNYIFDALRQGEKYLWAISNDMLYRMDITTRAVEKALPADSTYMGLYTCCLDESGNIWIGTIGNGLIEYNTNTGHYRFLKDFLHHEIYSIYSVCYDGGKVWMGTDNGLYYYDIARKTLQKFDQREGTQGQVYYPLASLKGEDGKLYFGGTRGFTAVDPKKIARNEYRPKAIISDFFIDHKTVHPNYSYDDGVYKIILDYNQANFGFQFSSDNYHIPEKNLFKYRLKGYNNKWIETDASNRTAMYSKVPAGTYYFEVYAANNDRVWGDTPTVIVVRKRPAPWFSWPAYVLYAFVAMGVSYTIYRYYNEKKRLKMQLYLDSIEKEKKEHIHQAQLSIFTGISHDFRTPLSLIIAALDKLRREGLKEYYYRILNGNAQRLLKLVNELMDFRTVENGKMKLELQPLDINSCVREVASDFRDYAAQRDIDFRIGCDADLPVSIYADRNVIEKVVMNLLNNAFKYTREHASITLQTQTGDKAFASAYKNKYTLGNNPGKTRSFSIIVSDTGIGISGGSLAHVFERYYKETGANTDSHVSTGIGLALVKSLVLHHKGNLTIYSQEGRGTDIIVRFPLDKAVFEPSDFLVRREVAEKHPQQPQPEPAGEPEDLETKLLHSVKKKILVVEDNDDLRSLIAESLSGEFDVAQACDGLEALTQIADTDFDLIISDIMMPRKDGVSLCHDVKGNINTSHIPFVLLTAKTGLESKIEGTGSGANLYLEKPINLDYLKLSVQNIFRNQHQLREYYAKNFYADSSELSSNEQDNKFLKQFIAFIEANLDQSEMDINLIASELGMSRSKLYTKVKSLTGKSVVEFVLNYRLRKAARLIIEENITMREVMMQIGIESQPYFSSSFKKMFGETPTGFAASHRKEGRAAELRGGG